MSSHATTNGRLDPVIFHPKDKHTHTMILLHGLGSNARKFGNEFMSSSNLASYLPSTKFVFPSAKRKRTTVFKRAKTTQWFDRYSLDDIEARSYLQTEGLKETSKYIWEIIDEEAALLGGDHCYDRIILGGLSQGCSASIITLLSGDKALGGYIGMSGSLPYAKELTSMLAGSDEQDEDDMFGFDADDEEPNPFEDDENKSALSTPAFMKVETPVFLGHGDADEKISIEHGRKMSALLKDAASMDVTWKEYKDFGHWYKIPDEIDDIVEFLARVEVPVSKPLEQVEWEAQLLSQLAEIEQD